MAQILQRALDSRVSPARVLRRHADDQTPDLCLDTGSSWPPRSVGPLARDEFAMPAENRIGRHDRCDIREQPAAKAMADGGEPPTFVVAQPHPTAMQLRLEHAILFPQEVDDVAVLAFQPAEQRRDDQVQGKHPRSLRDQLVDPIFGHYAFENTIANHAILTRPPGRRYLYSNLGYGILDHIIERVAGVTYAEFMHRELFEPLQLWQTSVPTAPPSGAAVRYSTDNLPLPFYDVDHRGASSVYASAHDLVRFGMFHLDEGASDEHHRGARVLQAKSIREMQRVHTQIDTGAGYGLGWRIDDADAAFVK